MKNEINYLTLEELAKKAEMSESALKKKLKSSAITVEKIRTSGGFLYDPETLEINREVSSPE